MQRLLIDCRFAATGTGLSRFTRELVSAALALPELSQAFTVALIVRSPDEEWLARLPRPVEIVPCSIPHYSLQEHTVLPALLRQAKADVYLSLQFNIPFWCPIPCAVVCHDLILHRYPNGASWLRQLAYRLLLQRSLRQAKRVLAVSHATADDLRQCYGSRILTKTVVLSEGVSAHFAPATAADVASLRQRYGLTSPYVAYVGNAKAHKGVAELAQAVAGLHQPGFTLALVSGDPAALALRGLPNVQVLTKVTDDELPALYTGALAFVSLSHQEGFGLPLLEAAACGCPSIVRDIPAFREIARPSTRLVANASACVATLRQCAEAPWRDDRTQLPTWQQPAERLLTALRSIGSSSH